MLRCLVNRSPVIFGDGSQTRDFTFVEDTARGIMLAGVADNVLGETINIGSGREVAIKQLADQIQVVTKRKDLDVVFDSPRPGDVLRLWADSSKAQRLLGFVPNVTLGEGLERLLHWYSSLVESPAELLKNEVLHNWIAAEKISQ